MSVSKTAPGAKYPFVLIHGAFVGAWAWREVAPRLRALGHPVWTPTLTGLGERRHLAGNGYDLTTHITDVVAMIEMEDLRDIHLLAWSYGGAVGTGVLAQAAERVRSMTYFDAFVPENGQAMIDVLEPWVAEAVLQAQAANQPLAPIPLSVMGLTDPALVEFVEPRMTSQAWQTFTTPVKAISHPDIPFNYIRCRYFDNPSFDRFHLEFTTAGHATHILDTGHMPMLDHVDETVALLAKIGRSEDVLSAGRLRRGAGAGLSRADR